jgi:nucleoside-diphosphate-sugar epimerase
MKAFVTGGTGAVGRAFLPRLLRQGWEVKALTRDPAKPGLLRHERLNYLAGDLDSQETIAALLTTPAHYDVVFHLAASLAYFGSLKRLIATNAGGTANMVRFARHAGARRFVYASSVEAAGSFTLSETPAPAGRTNPAVTGYGASKVIAERHALALWNEGIPAICVRIGNVYGRGWKNIIIEFASNLLNRGMLWEYLPVLGHRYLSPVHNEDVADGLLAAAACSYSGIVNLVGEAATIEEILHWCADAMGVQFTCGRKKPFDAFYAHYIPRCFHWTNSFAYLVAPRWPRVHRGFAMDESSRRLAWSPRWPLPEGVRENLKWAKDNGLLSF